MSRPKKLTPELQAKLISAIVAGNYPEAAAVYAGVSKTTFYRWMREGEQAKSGALWEFWHAVEAAEAKAEVAVVAQWRANIPDSWQAARDYLARRHAGRWGPKESLTVQGEVFHDVEVLTLDMGHGDDDDG